MRRLNGSEWRALVAATPRLLVIWVLLPVLGIARLRRVLGRNGRPRTQIDPNRIEQRVIALRRLGARLPGCHCLARSIALAWWLDARGQPNRVRIGVAGTAVNLRAHSWVEIDGKPVDDTKENIAQFQHIHEI